MSSTTDNNAHIGSGSDLLRRAMQARRVESAFPHLTPILDVLPASATVLEVGCGPGGITLDIAQRYPQLRVLGMDIDEKSIQLAKEAHEAAGDVKNLQYSLGDAVNMDALASVAGFEAINEGCSLVYSHAAVMHTPDQLRVIKHMHHACKPGGTLAMSEGDAGLFFAYPDIPGMTRALEVFPRLGAAKGADLLLGRKLLTLALAAGFTRDQVSRLGLTEGVISRPEERAQVAYGFGEMFAGFLQTPEMLKAAGSGEEDVAFIREGLNEWSKCDGGILSFPSMVMICNKP